jgi:shikimate kinase
MSCPERIFLIGYRGTGKTTVACLLAERLGWAWLDTDRHVEDQCGLTIRELFAHEGEAGFRTREAAAFLQVCERGRCVVATGGGLVLLPAHRARLRDSGLVIWLIADARTIWSRLRSDPTTVDRRPALTPEGGLAEIERLLAAREGYYRECADLAIETTHRTPAEVVETICAELTRAKGRNWFG